MNRSDSLVKIAPALVKALSEIDGVAKTKANLGFKGSKYATLEAVIDASKEALTLHGLTVLQFAGPTTNGVLTMETMILHESGEFLSGEFGIAVGKMDPQGIGSAVTYARRYGLMAALNMPAVDDDGEAAMGRNHEPKEPVRPIALVAAETAIQMCNDQAALKAWKASNAEMLNTLPQDIADSVVKAFNARWDALKPRPVS